MRTIRQRHLAFAWILILTLTFVISLMYSTVVSSAVSPYKRFIVFIFLISVVFTGKIIKMIFRQISRVNRHNLNLTRSFIVSSKSVNVKSGTTVKGYLKGLLFGTTAGAIIYDGFNEFEVAGGVSRFFRSLKIAATISLDYSWSLYGLQNGTELYDSVSSVSLLVVYQFYYIFSMFIHRLWERLTCVVQIEYWMDAWQTVVCTLKSVKVFRQSITFYPMNTQTPSKN